MSRNRKKRRTQGGRPTTVAAVAGSALTVTALTVAAVPATGHTGSSQASVQEIAVTLLASEDNDAVPTFVTGPLLGLAAGLGLTDGLAIDTLQVGFDPVTTVGNGTKKLYDTINTAKPTPYTGGNVCAYAPDPCRLVPVAAEGMSAANLVRAMDALWSSSQGKTPEGFTDLDAEISTGTLALLFNNPLRPNGGILSRFAALLNPLGITTPALTAGIADLGSGYTYQSGYLDVTWAYNPLADFPVTLNPLSLLNSAMAVLPPSSFIPAASELTNGVQGFKLFTDQNNVVTMAESGPIFNSQRANSLNAVADVTIPLIGILQVDDFYPIKGALLSYDSDGWYTKIQGFGGKLTPTPWGRDRLPLLAPLDLPNQLINSVLTAVKSPYLLGNPLADILEPAMTILVNIGYPDVLTPADIAAYPRLVESAEAGGGGYQPYDRSFGPISTVDDPTPAADIPFGWFTNPGLTAEETRAAYGDAWKAFTGAIEAQFKKPFWGILVPNAEDPPAGAGTPTAGSSAAVASAPAQALPESAPEPVAALVVEAGNAAVDDGPAETAAVDTDDPAPADPAPAALAELDAPVAAVDDAPALAGLAELDDEPAPADLAELDDTPVEASVSELDAAPDAAVETGSPSEGDRGQTRDTKRRGAR